MIKCQVVDRLNVTQIVKDKASKIAVSKQLRAVKKEWREYKIEPKKSWTVCLKMTIQSLSLPDNTHIHLT